MFSNADLMLYQLKIAFLKTEQANEILWNVGYKENAWWHRFYRCDFTSSHKKTYNIQGALKEVGNYSRCYFQNLIIFAEITPFQTYGIQNKILLFSDSLV